jgi:deoxyadenosine/deoxycytidine kinase
VKQVWCQVVKEEMLEQVHSLDLIYEKETTQKMLEFKLKYLVSYATLMRNYFMHMNFQDIKNELESKENPKAV